MRESIVQLIFFVAIVAVTTVLVGSLVTNAALFGQSVERDGERSAAGIDAEIELVNDPAVDAYDPDANVDGSSESGGVTLYVKNVGGATLQSDDLDVLVDGQYAGAVSTTVLDGDRWRVGTVLEVTAEADLDPGEHRVQVDVRGSSDRFSFEHRIAYWDDPENATDDDGVWVVERSTVDLTIVTEPAHPDETVAVSTNESETATVDPETVTIGDDGTGETTLDFDDEPGTVAVTLDTGWATDEIVVRYEETG
ncbi:flagellin [Halovivax gelatinilyticus]|uniref:flagellin n=1 Tax=Halovivax gelatinilyticus TaxID=2961597 RepID=UPI0020CA6553|nr:flagellin [Halovivax gelatinilyticus]